MKFFSKKEFIGVATIMALIIFFTYLNLRVSLRRSRDAQRRADIDAMINAIVAFQKNYNFFPPSYDGKIRACRGEDFDSAVTVFEAEEKFDMDAYIRSLGVCEWGKDGIEDLIGANKEAYIKLLPGDPQSGQGSQYLYLSNANRFQFYAFLEGGASEDGYRESIVARNLLCGEKVCNYGKAYGETPLDKSIEEYEEELDVPVR